ncbi:hypothetical protein DFH09DRAFT_1086544 [Mycena vulgaris]|nr:hypothetical protein DFH09DRAFT_1086544 [Mycena vulgaris]
MRGDLRARAMDSNARDLNLHLFASACICEMRRFETWIASTGGVIVICDRSCQFELERLRVDLRARGFGCRARTWTWMMAASAEGREGAGRDEIAHGMREGDRDTRWAPGAGSWEPVRGRDWGEALGAGCALCEAQAAERGEQREGGMGGACAERRRGGMRAGRTGRGRERRERDRDGGRVVADEEREGRGWTMKRGGRKRKVKLRERAILTRAHREDERSGWRVRRWDSRADDAAGCSTGLVGVGGVGEDC